MHVETETPEVQLSPDDDCFAIRQAARFVTQLYDRHLARVGLKTTQFSIMCRLRRRKWMTMKELADSMVMERTSLVRAIQPLQRDGLVFTEASRSNRRVLTVMLTSAGEERLKQAREHWHAAQQEFEERFGTQRAASLREELFDMTRR
ncbi:MarR family winged helix-turn-helix transcriptional regulator [Paraburkholderia diazotrophica]|uniref:Transcriptional regulator, MarR family n=1 Tax=Paraburkholderia diazotrophica TaxID=667676 RepID=A0A1H6T3J7_9BURK|nr:MarR family transcriptional regulator [Paraburkholderia diazotrophica]SEI70372.1 transcriptional regulator, MarR family [Paraburkholderia diazotrophica]